MTHLAEGDMVGLIGTSDFEEARRFYGDTLGLPLVEESAFALVFQSPNARLRVTKVDLVVAAPYTVLGWTVPHIMTAVRELTEKGVDFIQFDGIGQDDSAVWPSPSGAKVAWFKDPDGNMLSLTEP